MTYDVIIAGHSFAGLAVASQLRGKVLLIDPKPIGVGQTSACGTLFGVPERLGLMDSVLQVHPFLAFHTPARTERYDVQEHHFCTFDYRSFCEGMAGGTDAQIVRAAVKGVEGSEVITDQGRFRGAILVDASGWRAVLANSICPGYAPRDRMSYGIETVAPRKGESLSFWYDPNLVPEGVAWFFPIGQASRIGVASYAGNGHLRPHLDIFLDSLGLAKAKIHGGYFPWSFREPTLGNLFVVGDAAGQCLPLTGEGIRPAIYFGQACGRILQRVLEGRVPLRQGLNEYRAFVLHHRGLYRFLGLLQGLLMRGPVGLINRLVALACREPLRSYILKGYVAFADPARLTPVQPKMTAEAQHRLSVPVMA
ncbi:MAG: NAD(P)/FAD-dependent oxidoreductase [Candidatus Methylomirabilales bacterium]